MKTGLLGGTFDPIHYAHLLLAETARETLGLDRVVFIPAGIPPHKQTRPVTPGPLRAAMIRAAIAGYPEFEISTFEIDSDEVSYTLNTLRHFHRTCPGDELTLIVGTDTFNDIPNWYRPAEVCGMAEIAAALRPGGHAPDYSGFSRLVSPDRLARMRGLLVSMPLLDISSTEIRRRAAAGRSLRFMTPDSVIRLIGEHHLYTQS